MYDKVTQVCRAYDEAMIPGGRVYDEAMIRGARLYDEAIAAALLAALGLGEEATEEGKMTEQGG